MKHLSSLIVPFCLLIASTSWGATKAYFINGDARVMIAVQAARGESDDDAERMFAAMNVEIQDSFVGRGKAIKFGKDIMTQVCSLRNNTTYTCSILIQASAHSKVSARQQTAEFAVTGEEARQLWSLFHPNDGSNYEFTTSDGLYSIQATPGSFRVRYGRP